MKKDNEENIYLKTSDLEVRGWTKGMIKKYMPEPCKTRSNRPAYYGVTNLYSESRVLEIEGKPSFEKPKQPSADRSIKAKDLAERIRRKHIESIEKIEIKLEKIDDEILLRRSIDAYNEFQLGKNLGWSETASEFSDREFLERIQVNFIRHELTPYECMLAAQFRQIGRDEAERIIREKSSVKIKEVYPHLKDEVDRQLHRKESFSL